VARFLEERERADVRSVLAGDTQAFTALYDQNAEMVYQMITRLVGPDPDREDLLQEVFVRLHRSLATFRQEAKLSTYLHRITVNVALSHLKRRKRRRSLPHEALVFEEGPGISPSEAMCQRQEVDIAMKLLEKLTPKKRVSFVLREVMGLSFQEIGVLMGARPDAVRLRVKHATRELTKIVERRKMKR